MDAITVQITTRAFLAQIRQRLDQAGKHCQRGARCHYGGDEMETELGPGLPSGCDSIAITTACFFFAGVIRKKLKLNLKSEGSNDERRYYIVGAKEPRVLNAE